MGMSSGKPSILAILIALFAVFFFNLCISTVFAVTLFVYFTGEKPAPGGGFCVNALTLFMTITLTSLFVKYGNNKTKE